jgi:Leucine-rich repeat (LRR) protein
MAAFQFGIDSLPTWSLLQLISRKFRRCVLAPHALSCCNVVLFDDDAKYLVADLRKHLQKLTLLPNRANLTWRWRPAWQVPAPNVRPPPPTTRLECDLSAMQELRYLDIGHSKICDENLDSLSPLLIDLNLSNCYQLTDVGISKLSRFPRLQVLRLTHTSLMDLRPLSRLLELRVLHCAFTNVLESDLSLLRPLRKLETLHLSFRLSDVGLEAISDLTSLREIEVCEEITDAGLRSMARLSNLLSLDLQCCDITDDGLLSLSGLRNLKTLNVSFTPISDISLGLVLPFLQSLESLSAVRCPVQGRGLGALTMVPNLTMLDVSQCKQLETLPALPAMHRLLISDCPRLQNLQPLAASKSLSDLQWSFSGLGYNLVQVASVDDGLQILRTLPMLRVLNLARTHTLTERGISLLGQMMNLRELDLSFCQLTKDCIQNLKQLPLTTLKLSYTNLTPADLVGIGSMADLEHLDLSYVKGIGNRELRSLSGLSKLRCLNLYNHLCVPNLDAKGLFPQAVVLQTWHQFQLCGFA